MLCNVFEPKAQIVFIFIVYIHNEPFMHAYLHTMYSNIVYEPDMCVSFSENYKM